MDSLVGGGGQELGALTVRPEAPEGKQPRLTESFKTEATPNPSRIARMDHSRNPDRPQTLGACSERSELRSGLVLLAGRIRERVGGAEVALVQHPALWSEGMRVARDRVAMRKMKDRKSGCLWTCLKLRMRWDLKRTARSKAVPCYGW